jgi:tetratricopeptide (TPR) repeat protein
LLDSLENREAQGDVIATPFAARANERFLHGEILVSMGRHAEALRWFESIGDGAVSEIPLRAPSHLRQAEIHQRLGNHEQAMRHYQRFLALWRDADPEFQARMGDVRHQLNAMRPGRNH